MPKQEKMMLVLLILPLPYCNAAGVTTVQWGGHGDGLDRYLQRGVRDIHRPCQSVRPGRVWGKCCLTRLCSTMCCARADCTCVYHTWRGHGCSCVM
nr:conotoxin GeXXA precursor [Conus generalis]